MPTIFRSVHSFGRPWCLIYTEIKYLLLWISHTQAVSAEPGSIEHEAPLRLQI